MLKLLYVFYVSKIAQFHWLAIRFFNSFGIVRTDDLKPLSANTVMTMLMTQPSVIVKDAVSIVSIRW